jgi:hypothetical protein
MADYSHHHAHREPRASHEAGSTRLGWLLAALAVLMTAVLAWVWTQQQSVPSTLPGAAPVERPAIPAPSPASTALAPAPPSAAVAAAGDTRPMR